MPKLRLLVEIDPECPIFAGRSVSAASVHGHMTGQGSWTETVKVVEIGYDPLARIAELEEQLSDSLLVVSEDKLGWFAIHPRAGSPDKPIAIFEKKDSADTHCDYGNEFNPSKLAGAQKVVERDKRIAELESKNEDLKRDVANLEAGINAQDAALTADINKHVSTIRSLQSQLAEAQRKLNAINTPELYDFQKAVALEAQHQRLRWGSEHDTGKTPADWFWLVGYLAGKALNAHMTGNTEKALHHTITVAAATANWHAAILGATNMRPGIDPVERGIEPAPASAERK